MLPAARSEPTAWLPPPPGLSSEAKEGEGARWRELPLELPLLLPLSLVPREVLLSLEPLRCCCCCCLGTTNPPPVRCTGASELLAASEEEGGRLRGEEDEARVLRCRWEGACDAEAMMDRALRKAVLDKSGLAALLLSLPLDEDSTTLGMMKPLEREGAGVGRLDEAERRPLGWGGGEAAMMLSGESWPPPPPPPSPEDPLSCAEEEGGDCRPPCERGSSRSSSPLSACCACDRREGVAWF